jgi:polygalacturonase
VFILNSTFSNGNGIVVGSEAVNGVYNVLARNIVGTSTSYGLLIEAGRTRGSQATGDYNIMVDNMTLTNARQPLVINAYSPASDGPTEPPHDPPGAIAATTPNIHDITVSGLRATGAAEESLIAGLPESRIRNVNLTNVTITTSNATAGFQLRNMTGTLTNVNITDTHSGSPIFAVQENVNIGFTGTPGLPVAPLSPTSLNPYTSTSSTEVTSPLTTTPAGAPCGRYALGTTP